MEVIQSSGGWDSQDSTNRGYSILWVDRIVKRAVMEVIQSSGWMG